jgi:hypothetical protein
MGILLRVKKSVAVPLARLRPLHPSLVTTIVQIGWIRLVCKLANLYNMLWNHHQVGFLDEVFTIFDDHSHPVVLIGDQALRWMAVALMTDEVR